MPHKTLLPPRCRRRPWSAFLAALCIVLARGADAAQSLGSAASSLVWILISDEEKGPYARFLDALRDAAQLPQQALALSEPEAALPLPGIGGPHLPKLVVAVGIRASTALCNRALNLPALLTLVPKPTYDASLGPTCRAKMPGHSVVFIDQPLHRQVAATQRALPHHRRAVVLTGPTTRSQRTAIETTLKESNFEPVLAEVDKIADVFHALERVPKVGTVLLALPDPLVFTARSTPHILLAAYRYRIPVIGYTESYARAGALLAVYSTPEQLGRQVGEVIREVAKSSSTVLPLPQYPKYFSVAINRQVARSLALTLPTEAQLHTHLLDLEDGAHD